jgi:predicted DNA-binding transcriptional regulator AlpA
MLTSAEYMTRVRARAGVGAATVRTWVAQGKVPRPTGYARGTRWHEAAVDAAVRQARIVRAIDLLRTDDLPPDVVDAVLDAVEEIDR